MTGFEKAYSAPQLETLSMRATRDIDIHVGAPGPNAGVSVNLGS